MKLRKQYTMVVTGEVQLLIVKNALLEAENKHLKAASTDKKVTKAQRRIYLYNADCAKALYMQLPD